MYNTSIQSNENKNNFAKLVSKQTPHHQETGNSVFDSAFYSHDSEHLVLSIMLNEDRSKMHLSLMNLLSFEDFFIEQHQIAWKIITSMKDRGLKIDPAAVIDQAKKNGEFIGGSEYIMTAYNDPIGRRCSDESLTASAARIKNFAMTRRLQAALNKAIALNNKGQGFDHVTSFIEDEIINLKRQSESSRSGPREAGFFYDAIVAKIIAKGDGEEVEKGIPTGFHELDQLMGGELPKEGLIILAGRPGMGKTAFATAIEQNISCAGIPTLFFSLEMTGISLAQRNISRHSRILFKNIKSSDIGEHEYERLVETVDTLGRAPCYIDETPGLSIAEIRSRARSFLENHPKGVIFLDYIQIVQPSASSYKKDQRVIVAETSQGLIQMARELKCPVFALAQLSRDLEKRVNKRPVMSDLRESGQLEQDASIIMFLYRDEVYNTNSQFAGTTEVILAKNRDGECATVKFASDLSRMHYIETGVCRSEE